MVHLKMDALQLGVVASIVVGATTGLEGVPVLFMKSISQRVLDALLGFAAGVMLAATTFSLLMPAIDLGGFALAAAAFIVGAVASIFWISMCRTSIYYSRVAKALLHIYRAQAS